MNGDILRARPLLSHASGGIAQTEDSVHEAQKTRMADETGIEETRRGEKMIFVGIDPAAGGALVFLSETSRILYAARFLSPERADRRRRIDGLELTRQLSALREPRIESLVTIEDVHSLADRTVTSDFSCGESFGRVLGIIEALGLRHQIVHPNRWKNLLFTGVSGDPKRKARLTAKRLWPANMLKHAGMTDALLLAEFGRRTWVGQPACR